MTQTENTTSGRFSAFLSRLTGVAQFFCTSLMVIMTVVISWQIFGRYVLNDTPKWSEQLAGILIVYLTLIGGAIAIREDRHIALTYFRDKWSKVTQARTELLVDLLIAGFGAVMVFYGVQMAELVRAWTIPTLGLSQGVNYYSFPVSGMLIILYAIEKIRRSNQNQ